MLIQLHRQSRFDTSKTEFVAQCDPSELGDPEKDVIQRWIAEVAERHPLADGECWLLCDETYPKFERGPLRDPSEGPLRSEE